MADIAISGMRENGAQVDEFVLNEMNINYCTGCNSCIKLGKCVIKDDAAKILDSIKNCDGIVFATPIYFFSMTAQLKTLVDRLYALYVAKGENTFTGMKMGLILSYGGKDMQESGAHNVVSIFNDICSAIGGEVVATVDFSANQPYEVKGNLTLKEQTIKLGDDMLS